MQSYLMRSSWKIDEDSPPNEMGTCGCSRLSTFATSTEPWQCGIQCKSMPNMCELSRARFFSTSKFFLCSIIDARL